MSYELDDDVEKLIGLLLRKHAREHNDYERYSNISSQLSFEIANRGLGQLGLSPEKQAPLPEPKK